MTAEEFATKHKGKRVRVDADIDGAGPVATGTLNGQWMGRASFLVDGARMTGESVVIVLDSGVFAGNSWYVPYSLVQLVGESMVQPFEEKLAPEAAAKPKKAAEPFPHTCRCGARGLELFASFDCSARCSTPRRRV